MVFIGQWKIMTSQPTVARLGWDFMTPVWAGLTTASAGMRRCHWDHSRIFGCYLCSTNSRSLSWVALAAGCFDVCCGWTSHLWICTYHMCLYIRIFVYIYHLIYGSVHNGFYLLYYITLIYIVLYYIILYYIILYYIILYYIVFYYIVLYYIVLYCNILYCIIFNIILHYIKYYNLIYHTILYYIKYYVILYHIKYYIVLCYITLYIQIHYRHIIHMYIHVNSHLHRIRWHITSHMQKGCIGAPKTELLDSLWNVKWGVVDSPVWLIKQVIQSVFFLMNCNN